MKGHTVVNTAEIRRTENPGLVIVGECASTSKHGRRARLKERLVVDRLDIHVVEDLLANTV